ncbi:MAG: hypothetical protein GY854_35055 [Deltaproteobacteria bacterium]|nr:hypothetical protein [Deltaproteobacteria bacterium]
MGNRQGGFCVIILFYYPIFITYCSRRHRSKFRRQGPVRSGSGALSREGKYRHTAFEGANRLHWSSSLRSDGTEAWYIDFGNGRLMTSALDWEADIERAYRDRGNPDVNKWYCSTRYVPAEDWIRIETAPDIER